jgi:hypothetical protein
MAGISARSSRIVEVGRQPRARVMDLLIAATAHAHGAAVYTRNADDLAGLEDLIAIHPILSSRTTGAPSRQPAVRTTDLPRGARPR